MCLMSYRMRGKLRTALPTHKDLRTSCLVQAGWASVLESQIQDCLELHQVSDKKNPSKLRFLPDLGPHCPEYRWQGAFRLGTTLEPVAFRRVHPNAPTCSTRPPAGPEILFRWDRRESKDRAPHGYLLLDPIPSLPQEPWELPKKQMNLVS